MITIILPNGNPTIYEGASHKETVTAISRESADVAVSFNLCDFQCPYIEPAFAESGVIVDEHKNDFTRLLIQLSLTTDTAIIKIIKCENGVDVEKATIVDNTFGTFFVPSFFPDNLKIGFEANWNAIFNAFGHGDYKFTVDTVLIGVASTTTSWIYSLQEFSEEAASDTVLIKSEQARDGIIEGGIDYTGFNWINTLRIFGTFGQANPTLEKDHYQTQGRLDRQIRDKITTNYTLETELIPFEVISPFIYDNLLANSISIMNYDLFGFLPLYKFIDVVPEEIEEPTYFPRNTNGKFTITFSDKLKVPVKSNFN